MFKTRRFEETHIEASLQLLHNEYLAEKDHHPTFLSFEQTKETLKEQLIYLNVSECSHFKS